MIQPAIVIAQNRDDALDDQVAKDADEGGLCRARAFHCFAQLADAIERGPDVEIGENVVLIRVRDSSRAGRLRIAGIREATAEN